MSFFITLLFQQFVLSAVALLIAWLVPGLPVGRKATGKELRTLFALTWLLVFTTAVGCIWLAELLGAEPEYIQAFDRFLIPLITGIRFARILTRDLLLSPK
ncbi:MAG: hypothetical protein ABIQ90_05380 [Polaromonas sp.]